MRMNFSKLVSKLRFKNRRFFGVCQYKSR